MRKRAVTWMRRSWRSVAVVSLAATLAVVSVGCAYLFVLDPQPRSGPAALPPDTTSPSLESVVPISRKQVDLRFSEVIAASDVSSADFSFEDGTSITAAEVTPEGAVRLTLARLQVKGRPYTVAVEAGAVADRAGNLNLGSSMRFAGFGATGGVLTIEHGGGPARPKKATAQNRSAVVVVDQLALTANGGDIVLSQMAVRALTSGDDIFADLVEAWIFEDNGDGRFQADGRDRQLHLSVPFKGIASGAPATFSGLNYVVESGRTKTLWVVFRLGNLAKYGRYIGCTVRPEDIRLAAGTLGSTERLVSANGGRTVYITDNVAAFDNGQVIDPSTVIVTLGEGVPPSAVTPTAFTVNGDPVEGAELGPGGTTVRLTTKKPLTTKTVSVDFTPGDDVPADVGVFASFAGPTYQSPDDTRPPTTPTGVSASVGTTSPVIATVSWSPANDGVNPVAGYRIWRATSAAGMYRSIATTPSSPFRDTSGVPDQTYFYKVSAYDAASNESSLSVASGSITATWSQQPHATYGSGNLCALCHSSHNAATEAGILRSITGGTSGTSLCYQCHDGTGASNVKTGVTDSFALASGHVLESLNDTTNVDLTNTCNDCHGPHQNRTGRPTLWRSVINGNTVTGNNNTWCNACHDAKHSWYRPGEAAYDSLLASPSVNATRYPILGTYPGSDVATNPAKNAHASVTEIGQSEPFACLGCHDNHRGTSQYDMLLYQLRPSFATTSGTVQNERQSAVYAQMCIRCHDAAGGGVGATDIKQFVTADWSDATKNGGHRVLSPGATQPQGSPLPCYECHNVHGSGRSNNSNISDARGRSLTTTEPAEVRKFCLTCHSTGDATPRVWDSIIVNYRSVRATETVVGLPRNGSSPGPDAGEPQNWLKLKAVDGHYVTDTDKSCYKCHGNSYTPGKNNVHNPGPGESAGGLACLQCHDVYNAMRTNTSYHHYMVSDSAAPVVISNPATLTTTASQRTCLTCHVDHDIFNPTLNVANTNGRAANLRASISTAPVATNLTTFSNTDFDPASGTSVCTSCHRVGLTKNTANRLSATDRSPAALKVTSNAYRASAHNYQSLTATFLSDVAGKAFKPNCSKCHDDRRTSEFMSTRQIASHDDTRPALITDFGNAAVTADAREGFCFACHSRANDPLGTTPNNPSGGTTYTATTGMKDVYGSRSMDATSVNIKGQFVAPGIVSSHPVTATLGPQVECSNCHSVHAAGGPNALVVNPDNTIDNNADGGVIPFYTRWYAESNKPLAAQTNATFCIKCHDGAAPVRSGNTSTTYVPYDVTVPVNQSMIANPTRRTNNKDDYQPTSHYNTGVKAATAKQIDATCADCHDRHGSTLPALLGVPNRTSAQNFLGSRYIYNPSSGIGSVVTGNDNSVCIACHSATPSWPTTSAGSYPTTGRWPGTATFTGANGIHKGSTVVWPGRTEYAGGDCKNCHDPHGTANPYDQLRTDEATLGTDTYRYQLSDYSFCLNCHDSSGPGKDIKSKQPVSVGGTSAETTAGHTVHSANAQGVTVGEPVPCWVCHSAHGTSSTFGLLIGTGLTGNSAILGDAAGELSVPRGVTDYTDPAYATVIRQLCLSCHTTASLSIQDPDDMQYGWNGSTFSKVPTGTIGVLGLDRTNVTTGLRLKSLLVDEGHLYTDTQNCLQCHNDIHKPVMPLPGATNCYNCHKTSSFTQMNKDDAGATSSYHHVLGTGGTPDQPFGLGPYPASGSGPYASATRDQMWCLTCHVDHNYFDDRRGIAADGAGVRARNLRTSYNDTPSYVTRANTDFIGGGQPGICVSCHMVELDKKAQQKTGAGIKTRTPLITETTYTASAHQYKAASTVVRDASSFQSDCAKCHNSSLPASFATKNFTVHASPERSLLASMSVLMTDPIGASNCLGCHSEVNDYGTAGKKVTGKDYYGGETMTVAAEKVFKVFNTGVSRHPVAGTATGNVACENCHNPHLVSQTATQTSPSNGYRAAPYTAFADRLAYCLECHDGTLPQQTVSGGVYIPVTVRASATWANKAPNAGSSHWQPNGSIQSTKLSKCDDCHDKHGSRYEKLVGASVPTTDAVYVRDLTGVQRKINGNDESVCYVCHDPAGSGYPTGVATTATVAEWDSWKIGGYVSPSPSATRTAVMWPGKTVYALSPHGSNAWTAPPSLGGGPAKDCNACHDVHGTAEPYDEFRMAYKAGDYSLCFQCHEGSYSSSTNIKQYYPAGGNFGDNAGHRIKTAGGTYPANTPLPCWECHLTHGSADGNVALLSDFRWNGLSDLTINDADNRKFCFGCHTSEDRYRYSSADGTMVAVAASDTQNLIVGLPRSPVDPLGNRLILPHLQTGLAHYKNGTEPCYECHGEDYTGTSTPNVHNPSSGVSSGGSACYNCHTAYLKMEDDLNGGNNKTGGAAGNKTSYHHVLGSTTKEGDWAPKDAAYSIDKNDVYCTSCHTDHNYFNATKGANLRTSINSASGAATATSDFLVTGDNGVCVSCHVTALSKNTTSQAGDGTTVVPKITGSQFSGSAHQYAVRSYYDTATAYFAANCSKCHDDSFDYEQDSADARKRFGTHTSSERKLLGPLGDATAADPLSEKHCYRCHAAQGDPIGGGAKPVANKDWYGDATMTAVSQTTFQAFGLTGSKHPVDRNANGSYVECANCHNVHSVSATTPTVDPNDTYVTMQWTTANKSLFCLKCHDADHGPAGRLDSSFVPTTVAMAGPDLPLMDKTTYSTRGHWSETAGGAIGVGEAQPCGKCHDKHGSQFDKLIGVYTGGSMSINLRPVTGNNESVCYGCHAQASTYATTTPVRGAGGYIEEGTWLGQQTWERGYNATEHTGSPHAQAAVVWPGTGGPGAGEGGDCKQCHDVHGTANAKDALRTTVGGGVTFSTTNFSFCFACHDGTQPGVSNIATYYPVLAGGTSGDIRSGHRASGALPCYDCHNLHGTGDSAYSLMVPAKTGPVTTVVLGDQPNEIRLRTSMAPAAYAVALREFCFACHTTGDTTQGWAGTAGYQAVAAGTTFEGVDRTLEAGKLKLPNIDGHRLADTQSCYFCHGGVAGEKNVHNLGTGMIDHTANALSDYNGAVTYAASPAGCANSGAACHGATRDLLVVHNEPGCTDKVTGTPNCHDVTGSGGAEYTSVDRLTAPNDGTNLDCLDCHTGAYTGPPATPDRNLMTDLYPAGHYSITTHTADPTYMATQIDGGLYTLGNRCSNCHNPDLKPTHTGTTTQNDVVCTECHNSRWTVVASDWKGTTAGCDDCHGTLEVNFHQSYDASHTATDGALNCASSGAGCHDTSDLRDLHRATTLQAPTAGCTVTDVSSGGAACHAVGVRPTAKSCGTGQACHQAYTDTTGHKVAVNGNEALYHQASSVAMTSTVDGATYNTGGGNRCGNCHSASLTNAHTTSAVVTSCTGCHNRTAPNSVYVIKIDGWSAQSCEQCHVTNLNGGTAMHNTYANHNATAGSCGTLSSSCHGWVSGTTIDVRVAHNRPGAGCTAFGTEPTCHAVDTPRTTGTMGCGTGAAGTITCHAAIAAGHGVANHDIDNIWSTSYASQTTTFTYQTIPYSISNSVGCGGTSTFGGANAYACHFSDLVKEHAPLASGGAGRTLDRSGSNCGVCHGAPIGTGAGSSLGYETTDTVISAAITANDLRCETCHRSTTDGGTNNGVQMGHQTTGAITTGSRQIGVVRVGGGEFKSWTTNGVESSGGHRAFNYNPNWPLGQGTAAIGIINGVNVGTALDPLGTYSTTNLNPRTNSMFVFGDIVLCEDCHWYNSAPAGPQGATVPFYVDGSPTRPATHWYNGSATRATNPPAPCNRCHLTLSGNTHRSSHPVECQACHVRVPHAWKRPRLMRRVAGSNGTYTIPDVIAGVSSDIEPYATPAQGDSMMSLQITAGQANFGSSGGCNTNCDNTDAWGLSGTKGHEAAAPWWP